MPAINKIAGKHPTERPKEKTLYANTECPSFAHRDSPSHCE